MDEDADQLVSRDYLEARLQKLEKDILIQLIASERAQRTWIFGTYALIFGTYALIIAAVYVNHFWK